MAWNYYENIKQYGSQSPMGTVVVDNNGKPLTASSSSSSSLQKIIDSGVPITGGNSAGNVASTAASMAGLAGLNVDFNGLFDLIRENTAMNNAWSAAQAQKQMDFQTQANQIAMDFNAAEAAKTRDWQTWMSNTAHQREIEDLKAAGLNPVLSASGGNGAAVGSAGTASGVTSSGAQADADQSANTALAAIYGSLINAQTSMYNANLSAKTNLAMAQMQQEAQMYGAQLSAEAAKYGAGTAYAASVYGADKSFENNQAQREWNASHPNSWAQFGNEVMYQLFGNSDTNSGQKKSWIGQAFDWLKNAHEARKQN